MTGTDQAKPGLAGERRGLRDTAVGDLVRGQLCLYGSLALCVALRPQGLGANDGISYYGVHWDTFLPYAVGLLGAAAFTRRGLRSAAPAIPSPDQVRRMADGFALLMVGIILTPYTVSNVVQWTHRGFGSALFVLQLVLAVRLLVWTRDGLGTLFLLVQLAGGIASAVYVLRDAGFLIQAQLLFQLGFGGLTIKTVSLPLDGWVRVAG